MWNTKQGLRQSNIDKKIVLTGDTKENKEENYEIET